jgi:hypothetical protein
MYFGGFWQGRLLETTPIQVGYLKNPQRMNGFHERTNKQPAVM